MRICCISDTHQHHKKIIMPDCDMIIHAGDFTYRGEDEEVKKFLKWYGNQNAEHKILIMGNHEVELSKKPVSEIRQMATDHGITLLHNSHTEIVRKNEKIKIYGSPYSHRFGTGWAYNATEEELYQIYREIDPDVDIIVTHGPAKGRLDLCYDGNVGSQSLLDWIDNFPFKLKLHVTGHIHEDRGCALHKTSAYNYMTVNAAICGIPYTDININPITVQI